MASLLETQTEAVLRDPRARDRNMPGSDRTYFEILTDKKAGDANKWDAVESFRETFITAPSTEGQELRAMPEDDPRYEPPEAPHGGLAPGESITPEEIHRLTPLPEGGIDYDPRLEPTKSVKFHVNLGSLVNGQMSAGGTFLPGKPRPNSPTLIFNLPPGVNENEITADMWDFMLGKAQDDDPKEYQAAKEFDSALESGLISAGRELLLGVPALADLPGLVVRAADYIISPVGTNTLSQDVIQGYKSLFGLPDTRPHPASIYREDVPRIGERIGLYPTEYPNALFEPMVVIRPDEELAPSHYAFGKLLDETLANWGAPGALTPQQENEAQKIATFLGGVMGGSLSASGAARAAAKLAMRGKTLADLQDAKTLTKALYALANSPGASFGWGGKRRFPIPGGMIFLAKDQAIAGVAGTAMLMTPDEWGPTGKIMAGLIAPFSLGKARQAVTALTKGQGLPLIGGFLEPFTASGQQRLAARYLASVPGMRGNERLVVALIEDLDTIPKRAGQNELVTTPAYFNKVSDDLRQAEGDWTALRERGVSDTDIIAQLSQNPVYGKYFNEIPVFGSAAPTLKALSQAKNSMKAVSDGLYGAMSWLASGSPIKNEVLRASGERLRRAEQIFKDMSQKFEGDPAATKAHIQKAKDELEALGKSALEDHGIDAFLYNKLVEMVDDPTLLTENRISAAQRAVEAVENSFREMRQIEASLWTHIGADQIPISPENMALIGDKAAEIILNTPVAQRKQIPAFLYSLAGKNRLLSDEALESMARAEGYGPEVPASIRDSRAKLAEHRATRTEIESRPYESTALKSAKSRLTQLEAELKAIPQGQTIEDTSVIRRINAKKEQIAGARARIAELEGTPNPALQKLDDQIVGLEAKIQSLEDQILPTRTDADEAMTVGPNGILDNVNTLDEVLATRGTLLDEAARYRARTGGANSARMANDVQKYIIENWLQDPAIFGDAGATAAYDVARQWSLQLNERYTRGSIADFLRTSADRSAKADANQFLAKIIEENKVKEGSLPTGSLEALEAAMVETKAPFLIRSEDGALMVNPNASLTRGLEDVTWESIRTGGPDSAKLSAQLLREEILNRLALVGFDNGVLQPQIVEKSIKSWARPIAKIEESYPGFTAELKALSTDAEKLIARHKALKNPLNSTLDEALITGNLDDVSGAMDAGWLTRRVQADNTVAGVFLNNDPNVVARRLLADPAKLETDIGVTLRLLEADETGAATAGFKRAMFDEMTRQTLGTPETAGRMAGEAVLDPAKINAILTKNETALRQVFDDVVGTTPDGKPITSYDMLKLFNDEMSLGMAERLGMAAGTSSATIQLPLRGGEFIRNIGRVAGVWAAKVTGGPALVMAGAGGRWANKIYERGGQDAIFSLVSDALADPSLAKILLTETARLDKKGRFVFDKRLTKAVRPYQFLVGPRTQVIRVGMEEQREIDAIEREGGPSEIIFDPKTRQYIRQKIGDQSSNIPVPEPAQAAPPALASRMPGAAPVDGSMLAQARPLDRQQFAAATPQGAPPQERREVLQGMADMGMPLFANKGGLASLQRKPRQMVH